MRYEIFWVVILGMLLGGCRGDSGTEEREGARAQVQKLRGEAMGSYYLITYLGDEVPGLQRSVDSLLDAYNQELSLWVPESRISVFNESPTGVSLVGTEHFRPNLELARRVTAATGGAYDPTVAPLVRYWGFGGGERRPTGAVDSAEVRALLRLVGVDKLTERRDSLLKPYPEVRLDLNASAKGYGVDLLHKLLNQRGRGDHLIDIGGEMRAGGTKAGGQPWNVGIRLPEEDVTKVAAAGTLPLANGRALATSGNYLSYYEVDGETFSHTINPRTGFVERNRLLSASVLADDCATADAYATACMVLGPEEARALIERTAGVEGWFLVRGAAGELEIVDLVD